MPKANYSISQYGFVPMSERILASLGYQYTTVVYDDDIRVHPDIIEWSISNMKEALCTKIPKNTPGYFVETVSKVKMHQNTEPHIETIIQVSWFNLHVPGLNIEGNYMVHAMAPGEKRIP